MPDLQLLFYFGFYRIIISRIFKLWHYFYGQKLQYAGWGKHPSHFSASTTDVFVIMSLKII